MFFEEAKTFLFEEKDLIREAIFFDAKYNFFGYFPHYLVRDGGNF
jgi:hypothetical protein